MKTIESVKTVYLDGVAYIRVFFVDCDQFEDVEASYYSVWLSIGIKHGDIAEIKA